MSSRRLPRSNNQSASQIPFDKKNDNACFCFSFLLKILHYIFRVKYSVAIKSIQFCFFALFGFYCFFVFIS